VIWRERGELRWLEAGLPNATAVFSTRLGGVSRPPFEGLNLGLVPGDDPDAVRSNRTRLAGALGLDPHAVVIGKQVHGAELAAHDGPEETAPFADGTIEPPAVDGHYSAVPGLALMIFAADCLPIALSGREGVAMLHAGWRGLAAGIVGRGAAAVAADAAAVGPAIGPCCYEVGSDVLDALDPLDLGAGVADGPMLDLPEVARRLLRRAGVRNVAVSDLCTRCNPDLLFSHRGEGPRTGRQAGIVWRSD